MPAIRKTERKKIGLPPGSLVHVGEKKAARVGIRVMRYTEDRIFEQDAETVEDCLDALAGDMMTWINIDGLHDPAVFKKIGEKLNLHPLVLEDIMNTQQRIKIDDLGECLLIVTKMFMYDEKEQNLEMDQLSLILGKNFVITFQEVEGDIFDPIRERIRASKGRMRKLGADYLAYSLLDIMVDYYFVILDRIGENLEDIEEELMASPKTAFLESLHYMKKDIIVLRRSVWPLREIIMALQRDEFDAVKPVTKIFFKDLYDHTFQVIETIETYRDTLSGMQDLYLSSISNKMNEIMKVLTIIATIFIPITFIVGVYGMNFKYMPELEWRWGYPLTWLIIVGVTAVMLGYFKRKHWL
jgi:magnesium transporter